MTAKEQVDTMFTMLELGLIRAINLQVINDKIHITLEGGIMSMARDGS